MKCTRTGVMGHDMSNWVIDDDRLVESTLSERSAQLQKNIISWLENHSDEEKERTIRIVFKVLEDAEITKLVELKNPSNLFKVIGNIKNVDKETRDVVIDLIKYNLFNKE